MLSFLLYTKFIIIMLYHKQVYFYSMHKFTELFLFCMSVYYDISFTYIIL